MTGMADLHTHTKFSCDAKDDMLDMCQSAVDRGLSCISFTEHLDMNPRDYGYGFFNYEKFSVAIDRARELYGDRAIILKGLEFSEPHLYPMEFEQMLRKDFDLILGSIHWIGEEFVGERALLQKYSLEQIYEKYYEEVLKAVALGGFDVLAHFDFPRRYYKVEIENDALIDEIINQMVKQDIALEINTSPLRKGLNVCAPDVQILQKFSGAGGRKVTIGSDAHSCDEIGANFGDAKELIENYGRCEVGYYQSRRFIKISG